MFDDIRETEGVAATAYLDLILRGDALLSTDAIGAARLLRRGAAAAATAGDPAVAAEARIREALAWAQVPQLREARKAVRAAVGLADSVVDAEQRLVIKSNLGTALTRDAAFHDEAIELLRDVVTERRERVTRIEGESRALAAGLINLGVALTDSDRADVALPILSEAETVAAEVADATLIGNVCVNQAVAFSAARRPREARAAYAKAAEIYRRGGATFADLAYAVRGEAAVLASIAQDREALPLYREAIRLFNEANEPVESFRTAMGELGCRWHLGEPIAASELADFEARLSSVPLRLAAEMGRNLGNVYLRQGDLAAADRLYQRSRRIFRRIGAAGDAASLDMALALSAHAADNIPRAYGMMLRSRREHVRLGRWLHVAEADHNLALLLREMADEFHPPKASLLRAATARARSAVAGIDKFRHDLATAGERQALLDRRYPVLFPIAIELALRARNLPAAAAFIERARVQPVLRSRVERGTFYAEPAAVSARVGDTPVGAGEPLSLAAEAHRLTGRPATWIGWWASGTDVVASATTSTSVVVSTTSPAGEIQRLAAALPVPSNRERSLAGDDRHLLRRLVLWRVANGPLLRDAQLAEQLGATLPRHVREAMHDDPVIGDLRAIDDATLLWPLTRLLLPPATLADFQRSCRAAKRRALVVAPPTALGRVPWAALPITDPAIDPAAPRLIDVCDIVVALPISLSAAGRGRGVSRRRARAVVVADPTGDLRYARRLSMPGAVMLGHDGTPATRDAIAGAAARTDMLILAAHVRPGSPSDPTASAILVARDDGAADEFLVRDLADVAIPATCVVLGCDGAGAATGTEWTGIATGLTWGGAQWVVTTTWPAIEDLAQVTAENDLLQELCTCPAPEALWSWQRRQLLRWREHRDPAAAPCRWAGVVVTGSPANAGRHGRDRRDVN